MEKPTNTPPKTTTPTFEKIPVYDRREHLSKARENSDRNRVNRLCRAIKVESDDLKTDPFIYDYEQRLKNESSRLHRKIGELTATMIDSDKPEKKEEIEKEIKKSEQALRDLPLIHLAEFATDIQRIQLEKGELYKRRKIAEKSKDEDPSKTMNIDDLIKENEQTENEYQKIKIKLITYLLGKGLKAPGGKTLQRNMRRQIAKIQQERTEQGRELLYDEDAITLFVYQTVYRFYLWQGKLRKDGKTSYFLSHITEAIETLINEGFTGAPTLQAAAGHDDLEDLELHRENPRNPNSPMKPRKEWFFCPIEVYMHHLKGDPRTAEAIQDDIRDKALTTVDGVTKHHTRERDEENTQAFYEGLLERGVHPALIRLGEQPFNFETIHHLAARRQGPKLDEMIRNWPPIARNIEIWGIYTRMVRSCIQYYCPTLSAQFNQLQEERILSRLKQTNVRRGMRTLLDLLLPKKEEEAHRAHLMDEITSWTETFGKPSHQVEQTRRNIASRIHAACVPFTPEIVSIEISPKPLEHTEYIPSIEILKNNPDFFPNIREEDPMHEILILVTDADQIYTTALRIAQKIHPSGGIPAVQNSKPEKGRPYHGLTLRFDDQNFGPETTIRINSAQEEAMSKRGIFNDLQKSLPDWFRRRIKYALDEVKDGTLTITEAIDRIIAQPHITARSALKDKKPIRLPAQATFLDAARGISPSTLYGAKKAYRVKQMEDGRLDYAHREEVSLYDRVEDGDYFIIETGHENELSLAEICFAEDPITQSSLQSYFDQLNRDKILEKAQANLRNQISKDEEIKIAETEIEQLKNSPNQNGRIQKLKRRIAQVKKDMESPKNLEKERQQIRDEQHIKRAKKYLKKLGETFEIKDTELITLLTMKKQNNLPDITIEKTKKELTALLMPLVEEQINDLLWEKSMADHPAPFGIEGEEDDTDLEIETQMDAEDFARQVEIEMEALLQKLVISDDHLAQLLINQRKGIPPEQGLPKIIQMIYPSIPAHEATLDETQTTQLESTLSELIHDYQTRKEETLKQIGKGRLNPLKALALLIDREKPCTLKITAPADALGVLGTLGIEMKEAGVSIQPEGSNLGTTDPQTGMTTIQLVLTIPKLFNNYDLLKFILKLSLKYHEKQWTISITSELFNLTESAIGTTREKTRLIKAMNTSTKADQNK